MALKFQYGMYYSALLRTQNKHSVFKDMNDQSKDSNSNWLFHYTVLIFNDVKIFRGERNDVNEYDCLMF